MSSANPQCCDDFALVCGFPTPSTPTCPSAAKSGDINADGMSRPEPIVHDYAAKPGIPFILFLLWLLCVYPDAPSGATNVTDIVIIANLIANANGIFDPCDIFAADVVMDGILTINVRRACDSSTGGNIGKGREGKRSTDPGLLLSLLLRLQASRTSSCYWSRISDSFSRHGDS